MITGRKRKPRKLHLIKGTYQPCRDNKRAPKEVNEPPQAPEFLSPRAHELFGVFTARLQAMGYASSSHTEAIAALARTQEEYEILSKKVEEQGHTYTTAAKIRDSDGKEHFVKLIKANPAANLLRNTGRHLQALLSEFGLTPASQGKVSVPDTAKKPQDNWSDLAN